MTFLRMISALALGALLLACAPPDRYPISGEECSENDPVQDLDAADCTIPSV